VKPELFIQTDPKSIDFTVAFMNVGTMQATEKNFAVLKKAMGRVEKKLIKEIKMKRLKGVSVVEHPYFRRGRGSFDGDTMINAIRVEFAPEGMKHYDHMLKFAKKLGFKEKAISVMASEKISLDDMKGAVGFTSKYDGIMFLVKNGKVFRRGPHGAEYFIPVRHQDAALELRLRGHDDIIDAVRHNWGKQAAMVKSLSGTGMFRMKKIATAVASQNFQPGDYIYQHHKDEPIYARVISKQKNGGYKAVTVGGWSGTRPAIKSTNNWFPEPTMIKESEVPEKFKKAIAKKYRGASAERVASAFIAERVARSRTARWNPDQLQKIMRNVDKAADKGLYTTVYSGLMQAALMIRSNPDEASDWGLSSSDYKYMMGVANDYKDIMEEVGGASDKLYEIQDQMRRLGVA